MRERRRLNGIEEMAEIRFNERVCVCVSHREIVSLPLPPLGPFTLGFLRSNYFVKLAASLKHKSNFSKTHTHTSRTKVVTLYAKHTATFS